MTTRSQRPFRLSDAMVFVAATAVAFAILRQTLSPGTTFVTLGGNLEQRVFYAMHFSVPFPAMWSIALLAITVFDRSGRRRRNLRTAGTAACSAAVMVILITTLIASAFYLLHFLEEIQAVPRILSHGRNSHAMPPFANTPMEEIVGAAVLGTWASMALGGRWKCQSTWIDRAGRILGIVWIVLFLTYVYGYTG